MTRAKVKLEFIANDAARKTTFKKRQKGLMKKVGELSTLCGVDACAILYSPYDTRPDVWPSKSGARRVLSRFMNLPAEDQGKKMLDQETYLRQRISKANTQLMKLKNDNGEKEMTQLVNDFIGDFIDGRVPSVEGLGAAEVKELSNLTDKALDMVNKRIIELQIRGN